MSAPLSPHPATDPGGPLPTDLLEQQSLRIQAFYVVGVALWLVNLLMDIDVSPHGDRGPYRLLIEAGGAVAALATVAFARYSHASLPRKIDVGVFGIIPHAFALALLNSWAAQPLTTRPLSGTTVLLLFFGMMAPGRPRRMLAAALVAASMDPLGVWIAHLRGLPVPDPVTAVLLFYPNYVCAILCVAPAHLLHALGRQLREARALGSYKLLDRIGAGGMGEVWRARHGLLARTAAIKLVRPEVLGVSPDRAGMMLHRFKREAQATAALTSPHTIRVFDFGLTPGGTFYYVMELLDGRDLDSLVREFGPLPPARAMHLVRQICESLAEAHARGLVHRDVKPANVFACRMGIEYDFVKVLDFGLVKRDESRDSTAVTAPAAAMGTPGYMAPEVILGGGSSGAAVDVYAIGCVAYYLLTGHVVFRADSPMKVLLQHVQDQPVAPSRLAADIPPEVDAFVLACLEKDPARRPRTAADALALAQRLAPSGAWSQREAERWWTAHLPEWTTPGPVAMPDWDAVAPWHCVPEAAPR